MCVHVSSDCVVWSVLLFVCFSLGWVGSRRSFGLDWDRSHTSPTLVLVDTSATPIYHHTGAHVASFDEYKRLYERSINPETSDEFWREMSMTHLDWFAPFTQVRHGSFEKGDIGWFLNGKLNVSYNCIDRHVAAGKGDKVAILFEGDEPSDIRRITYHQLLSEVCKAANMLRKLGVRKGDAVCIYMPMVPEAAFAMLACARIGAPHSVVVS